MATTSVMGAAGLTAVLLLASLASVASAGDAPVFHYHTRHIPREHLERGRPLAIVTERNGLCDVLDGEKIGSLKDLGIDTVELRLTWWEAEPEPGKFDFSRFERDLKKVEAAGLKAGLMAWFNHPPAWYTGGTRFKCLVHGKETTTLSPFDPETIRCFDRLYREVASRFGDRIDFVYVCGSGDFGEPVPPQGVNHYKFSSPHSHVGSVTWLGDRFARAAWAKVSPLSPEEVIKSGDRATRLRLIDFLADRTADFMGEVFAVVRRHFPNARYGVPIGHLSDFTAGQNRPRVIKAMCRVSHDFTARWTGMAHLGEFGKSNVMANRVSSATRFYGCRFGEEAASYLSGENAANAVYEAMANGSTMMHNDYGNILRSGKANIDRAKRSYVGEPKTDVALLWPDIDERLDAVAHPDGSGRSIAEFVPKAAELRRRTNYEICDTGMILDGFLERRGIATLAAVTPIPPETEAALAGFRARGGKVVDLSFFPQAKEDAVVYRTGFTDGKVVEYVPSTGTIRQRSDR